MGSSAKKKAEKAADFKKTKLRVGKTAKKPDNFTSTSFRAKSIVLSTQSLHSAAPSEASKITHHLSLLSHHASAIRKESLAHLVSHPPPATALPKLLPLIVDTSAGVRKELLRLLSGGEAKPDATTAPSAAAFSPQDIIAHLSLLRLYVFSAMTHIDPDIRRDAVLFLSWALTVAGVDMVEEGGWRRGLRDFVGIVETGHGLEALKRFIEVGVKGGVEEVGGKLVDGLHWSAVIHVRRVGARAYAGLGLFGECEEGGEDAEGRRRWLNTAEGREVVKGLERALRGLLKDGGEKGRVGGRVLMALQNAAVEVDGK
ncbi:hypothetical protein EX30DRAFT_339536 [Ascodesmis nigricans]|uniref:Pre-rRNA-processing protein n=1 Tax=Ascodesmis nigricans TaxID=341454 RepID=A0A4S2N326_9PEZI|nr:hypothetical protein EX30DRAFT_339536 [Ascodesmis nigricans]